MFRISGYSFEYQMGNIEYQWSSTICKSLEDSENNQFEWIPSFSSRNKSKETKIDINEPI